jgi:hypothetical protein
MNSRDQRAEEVFATALEMADPATRRAYLDRACAGKAALRQEVESLLAAHEQAGDYLLHPAAIGARATQEAVLLPPLSEVTGTRIGRYKLLEQIGEGGFGVVWMAEQEEPVRRRVALKIIKLGMDTKEVVARFEAERQALAMMDHPNIATVFDGGATDIGRPYFVMELVKSVPITEYCDANQLSTRERLELFMQVCQAVQHAHQKGIIHRDLKPSNILVTVQDDRPVPKVIDFGVAKATQARLTQKTLFTRFHQWIGTPAYMSPEQAGLGSLDVDTRSDIYSLGVLLYELLTGRTPFDTEKLLEQGVRGGDAHRAGGGASQAQYASEHAGGGGTQRRGGPTRGGAGKARPPGARRPRLDSDEGARERPRAPLRNDHFAGARHPASPPRRARIRSGTITNLPPCQVRAAQSGVRGGGVGLWGDLADRNAGQSAVCFRRGKSRACCHQRAEPGFRAKTEG